jgi:hypothetical protein
VRVVVVRVVVVRVVVVSPRPLGRSASSMAHVNAAAQKRSKETTQNCIIAPFSSPPPWAIPHRPSTSPVRVACLQHTPSCVNLTPTHRRICSRAKDPRNRMQVRKRVRGSPRAPVLRRPPARRPARPTRTGGGRVSIHRCSHRARRND